MYGDIKVNKAKFMIYICAIRMISTVVKTCELYICNSIELTLNCSGVAKASSMFALPWGALLLLNSVRAFPHPINIHKQEVACFIF